MCCTSLPLPIELAFNHQSKTIRFQIFSYRMPDNVCNSFIAVLHHCYVYASTHGLPTNRNQHLPFALVNAMNCEKIIWIFRQRETNGHPVIVGFHTASKWTALVQFRYFYNTIGGSKACSLTCQIKKALAHSK